MVRTVRLCLWEGEEEIENVMKCCVIENGADTCGIMISRKRQRERENQMNELLTGPMIVACQWNTRNETKQNETKIKTKTSLLWRSIFSNRMQCKYKIIKFPILNRAAKCEQFDQMQKWHERLWYRNWYDCLFGCTWLQYQRPRTSHVLKRLPATAENKKFTLAITVLIICKWNAQTINANNCLVYIVLFLGYLGLGIEISIEITMDKCAMHANKFNTP